MLAFLETIRDGGLAAFVIVGMGMTSVYIIIDRIRCLYLANRIDASKLFSKIRENILEQQPELAIESCASDEVLPKALRTILEKSDREDDAIYQSQEIALTENLPTLSKKLGLLAMLANVSTLVGLLGTVNGLILSFSAVSSADPSQKQILLAEGISLAMNTTALGLVVAIPTMIFYTILNSRSSYLQEQLIEYSNRTVELLTTGHFQRLEKQTLFPENIDRESIVTPPSQEKVAA